MASGLLGRTNLAFPPVWLSLSLPDRGEEISPLVEAALAADVPIDITSQPGLWGGHMRGTEAFLTTIGTAAYENASDEKHASDLLQAHFIETLSSIGREHIDIYFLRIRRAVEEYQISGALEALELARQEGHIRFIGICCDGPSLATLGMWQFHDAFDVLLVPRNHYDPEPYQTLSPLARERRVGIVTSRPLNWGYGLPFVALPAQLRLRNLTQGFYGLTLAQAAVADLALDHPVMVGVRSAEEVRLAVEAPGKHHATGLNEFLKPFIDSFDDDAQWAELAASDRPAERQAAERRGRDLA